MLRNLDTRDYFDGSVKRKSSTTNKNEPETEDICESDITTHPSTAEDCSVATSCTSALTESQNEAGPLSEKMDDEPQSGNPQSVNEAEPQSGNEAESPDLKSEKDTENETAGVEQLVTESSELVKNSESDTQGNTSKSGNTVCTGDSDITGQLTGK